MTQRAPRYRPPRCRARSPSAQPESPLPSVAPALLPAWPTCGRHSRATQRQQTAALPQSVWTDPLPRAAAASWIWFRPAWILRTAGLTRHRTDRLQTGPRRRRLGPRPRRRTACPPTRFPRSRPTWASPSGSQASLSPARRKSAAPPRSPWRRRPLPAEGRPSRRRRARCCGAAATACARWTGFRKWQRRS